MLQMTSFRTDVPVILPFTCPGTLRVPIWRSKWPVLSFANVSWWILMDTREMSSLWLEIRKSFMFGNRETCLMLHSMLWSMLFLCPWYTTHGKHSANPVCCCSWLTCEMDSPSSRNGYQTIDAMPESKHLTAPGGCFNAQTFSFWCVQLLCCNLEAIPYWC